MDLFEVNHLNRNVLGVPSYKLEEIKAEYTSTDQQETEIVKIWMQCDPVASWRKIIHQLDLWKFDDIADKIRHYAEVLAGMCFNFIDS